MKKSIISIISIVSVLITSFSVSTAEVPKESAPCNATNEAIIFVENCIGDILTEIEDSIRNEVPSFNVQVADKLPLEKAMQSHCF